MGSQRVRHDWATELNCQGSPWNIFITTKPFGYYPPISAILAVVLVTKLYLTLCEPMVYIPPGSFVHEIFPGKVTRVGCYFLLQIVFSTKESNPCLLHWQVNSLPLSHQGSPIPHPAAAAAAAAAAKSLQLCPTLCDPIDGSPPGSPIPGILQARTLEWVAISFSNAWKWNMKVKSLSHVRLLATPWTAAHQAPLSRGFSRQE